MARMAQGSGLLLRLEGVPVLEGHELVQRPKPKEPGAKNLGRTVGSGRGKKVGIAHSTMLNRKIGGVEQYSIKEHPQMTIGICSHLVHLVIPRAGPFDQAQMEIGSPSFPPEP